MGLTKIEEMPEFAEAKAEIESYKNSVVPEINEELSSTSLDKTAPTEQN
jgi:hypothetical protein